MTSWRQPSMVRASNHALVARSSNTTASVSQSQRRREEGLMRSRRIKAVASDPAQKQLGVNERREWKGNRALPEQAPARNGSSNLPRSKKSRAIPEQDELALSVRRHACRPVGFDFLEGFAAAFADRRVARVLA